MQPPQNSTLGTAPLSSTHLVLIPSYNSGPALAQTVKDALQFWRPVWVILDGATDGSGNALQSLLSRIEGFRLLSLPVNQGKGAAVAFGMEAARHEGFSHALVMDADGQHAADRIPACMALSAQNPKAMIAGEPDFGPDAPLSRKYGRCFGNFFARVETLWDGLRDSLFGFRVYPIEESLAVLHDTPFGRRYDFDTFIAVQLYWHNVKPVGVSVPVRYPSASEGGVSHFKYVRDNLLLIRLHIALLCQLPFRLPKLVSARNRPPITPLAQLRS